MPDPRAPGVELFLAGTHLLEFRYPLRVDVVFRGSRDHQVQILTGWLVWTLGLGYPVKIRAIPHTIFAQHLECFPLVYAERYVLKNIERFYFLFWNPIDA